MKTNNSLKNDKKTENDNGNCSVEIREMTIDDLAEVFHLGERLFTARSFPNLYRTWDESEVIGIYQTAPEFCLVACIDGKPAGFTMGHIVVKARKAWDYGHLVWLGVAEEYQRLGIAHKLFQEFKKRMEEEGVRILIVDTESDNEKALNFFKNQGFSQPSDHVYLMLNLSVQNSS